MKLPFTHQAKNTVSYSRKQFPCLRIIFDITTIGLFKVIGLFKKEFGSLLNGSAMVLNGSQPTVSGKL